MFTVEIKNQYVDVLNIFGDLQTAVDLALQRYTIEQITGRLAELRQRQAMYQAKYGCGYDAFSERISSDETFVSDVETRISATWELDLADWEFCHRGIEEWTQRLQTLLLG
jgi:hypothetical protein